MTRRVTVKQFASAVRTYLAGHAKNPEPRLEGTIEAPPKPRGFIFVGTFAHGVPQGAPLSGTVMLSPGSFCIERPRLPEFHLLAVLVPFTAKWSGMAANLPVKLVGEARVRNPGLTATFHPRIQLRPVRLMDPPIVLALPPLLR